MKPLTGIDATFLYMESPEQPMHVGGLTIYEPPKDLTGSFFDHFKAFFLERIHLVPVFRQKLARRVLELDHPGWIEVAEIDEDYHFQHRSLPAPGSHAQLEALIAELHAGPLDRSEPLWRFFIIDRLESGNIAIYAKMHHAAIDGGAAMAIAAMLYDMGPKPRAVKPQPRRPDIRVPTVPERAILGVNDVLQSMVRQHFRAMEAIPQALGTLTDMLAPPRGAGDGKESSLPGLPGQVLAPKTPFNATITAKRSFAARELSLTDARAIAKATATKINDVVLAVCAGALRAYLQARKKLPGQALVAFVPISLRQPGDADTTNQVFGMLAPVHSEIADPIKRLKAIRKGSTQSKTLAGTVKDVAPKDFTLLGAPILVPGLAQLYGKSGLADIMPATTNLTVSNVPGPPIPVFCAGAKVIAMYPVSIPVHGIALNITVQSYMDKLDFGVVGDARALPDADRLGDLLVESMAELKVAAASMAQSKTETTR